MGRSEGVEMTDFASSGEAFRVARERASVAEVMKDMTLHTAILDAKESGMSIREVAVALQVPKSTVARHWGASHRCPDMWPTWGSEKAWREAHDAIWAHDPHELADDWVPYEWRDEAGQRTVTLKPCGLATLADRADAAWERHEASWGRLQESLEHDERTDQ